MSKKNVIKPSISKQSGKGSLKEGAKVQPPKTIRKEERPTSGTGPKKILE